METEDLLPCSQEPATGPYSETNELDGVTPYSSSTIHFNIILPPMFV
jgi:hypothetical protein